MKLILTSHVTPIIKALLKNLDPLNAKVLIIPNARDYHDPETFTAVTEEKVAEFKTSGFKDVEPLDLKQYFKNPKSLEKYLEKFRPNVVCAVGGDEFLLNTAIKLSGFDQFLTAKRKDKGFFYCGSSAGAIVVAKDLKFYKLTDESEERIKDRYHTAPIYDGLALTNSYIVPHLGEPEFKADVKKFAENLESAKKNIRYISKNGVVTINVKN